MIRQQFDDVEPFLKCRGRVACSVQRLSSVMCIRPRQRARHAASILVRIAAMPRRYTLRDRGKHLPKFHD